MKTDKRLLVLLLVAAAIITGTAFAAEVQKVGNADTKEKFDLVVAAVKQEMAPGGRYEFVQGKNLETVDQRLGEMQGLFDRFGSVDKMDQATKIKLYDDQEIVDGILTRDDSNRKVCERETTLGSNIPHVTCRTFGEIRRDQDDTRADLRRMNEVQSAVRAAKGLTGFSGPSVTGH